MSNPPDWLKSEPPAGKSVSQPAPDWLKTSAPAPSVKPSGMPDWLSKVAQGGSPAAPGIPAQPPAPLSEPEPPAPAAPAESDDLFAAMRAETPPPPAEDALPDFLSKASSEPEGGADLPDWMSSGPEKPAPEPSPSADVPDWMKADAGEPPAASEQETPPSAVPDWLASEANEPPSEPAPSADVPDWMQAEAGDQPPAPEKESAPGGAPDWLSSLDAPPPASADASAPDWLSSLDAPPSAGSPADAPDWLNAMADSKPEPESKTTEPAETSATPPPAADAPDWLNQMVAGEAPPPAAAPTPAPAESTPPSPAGADMPDWLNKVASGETPPPPAAPAPAPASPAGADVPDWLNQIATSDTPPPAPAAPPPAMDAPDWLNQMAAGETPPPSAAPAPAPASPAGADVPDWLNQIAASDSPAAPPPAAPSGDVLSVSPSSDAPDWLNAVAGSGPPSETPAAPAAAPTPLDLPPLEAPPAPPPAGSGEDLLDWMSDPDFNIGEPGTVAPPPGAMGEDLLGLTDDLAMSAAEAPADDMLEPAAVAGELPEWLRGLKPTSESDAPSPLAPSPTSELSTEDLGEIGDLRFDKIIGEAPRSEAAGPEKVGALKDVAGAIRPELVFDAQSLKAGKIVGESILTKEQERRILLLENLLLKQAKEVVVTRSRRGLLPLDRWLVALILIAAIAVPMALGFKLLAAPSAPSGGVSDAKKIVDSLPANSKVLMAFEYEPDTAPEMDTLAGVLLKHIAKRDGVIVVGVSTRPFGPHLADRAFRNAGMASAINLGYISGGSIGISGLTVGSVQGSPFSTDLIGHSSDLQARTLKELAPSLIVVLSAGGEDVRTWVEQAGKPTGIPMLAATGAGGAPLAAPYKQSGQLAALISGVNDAEAYRAATGQAANPVQAAIWNAQAVGSLVAAVMVVVGGVFYGLAARREQQEQNA